MPVTGTATMVASAPVNFGIYTPAGAPIGAGELLDSVAAAGYDGVDLGPLGYLGTARDLASRLAGASIGLAGGWVDLRYGNEDGFVADLAGLDAALDAFASVPVADARFAPRPTLACPANPSRYAAPGAPVDPRLRLSAADWPGFAARVQRAADRCRARGLEPAFHHHLGTDIETVADIEELLARTDVSLCLDTGHLWLAGGDPIDALRRWSDRIRQVHIKDGRRDVLATVRAARGDLMAVVAAGGFCPLGTGDLDLAAIVGVLRDTGYTGWIVVEQDVPGTGQDLDRILADQRDNRAALLREGI